MANSIAVFFLSSIVHLFCPDWQAPSSLIFCMLRLTHISAVLTIACSALAPSGGAQVVDTSRTPIAPLFTSHDAIGAGLFAAGTALLIPFDRRIAERLQRPDLQSNGLLSGTSTVFRDLGHPLSVFALATVVYGTGRIRRDERLTDVGLHTGEAVVAGELIGYVIKGVAGRSRPYVSADTNPTDFKLGRGFRKGEDYSSFPSGHATAVFAAAAALSEEGSRWWPNQTRYVTPLAYTGATMVALSRLYNNKHWASDVFLSTAIGLFSGTKLVQYQHAHTRNRLDRLFLSASVVPTGDGRMAVAISP